MELFTFILLVVIGIYLTVFAALLKLGLNTRKGARMKARIGETGTRIVYGLTGAAMIVIAFVIFF